MTIQASPEQWQQARSQAAAQGRSTLDVISEVLAASSQNSTYVRGEPTPNYDAFIKKFHEPAKTWGDE